MATKQNSAANGSAVERTVAVTKKLAAKAPSFGMSEGTRDELERNGFATCPFTGRKLTKEDL